MTVESTLGFGTSLRQVEVAKPIGGAKVSGFLFPIETSW